MAQEACRLFGSGGDLTEPAEFLARPETVLLVVEEESSVAGWVYGHELAHPNGERTMLLYSLDVAEGNRGKGYGKALVSEFVRHAQAGGCAEVWVLTDHDNNAGMATYSSAGGSADGGGQVMFTWSLKERHR